MTYDTRRCRICHIIQYLNKKAKPNIRNTYCTITGNVDTFTFPTKVIGTKGADN
jgi:hypothetical protein